MLILALLALALVIFELGSYVIELAQPPAAALRDAPDRRPSRRRDALLAGDRAAAAAAVSGVARSAAMAATLNFIVEHARNAGERPPAQQGAGRLRLRLPAAPGAHADARPRRAGARADGHADPALARAHRARQRQHRRAQPRPAGRLQRHRRRPADRRGRVRALAVARPHVRPGSVRPPVRRGGHHRSTIRQEAQHDLRHPPRPQPRGPRRRPARRARQPVRPRDRAVGRVPAGGARRRCTSVPTITSHGLRAKAARAIYIQPGQTVAPLPKPGARTIGRGTQAGVVYRLANGQLVYVQNAPSPEVDSLRWATSGTSSAARSR